MLTIISAATPLLLAAMGELVVEKSGVLNLGVEGMMLVGAVAAFAVGVATGNGVPRRPGRAPWPAWRMALLFGVLTLTLACQPGRHRPGADHVRRRALGADRRRASSACRWRACPSWTSRA